MISFWKTQWFNLVAGTVALVMFVVNLIQADGASAVMWLASAYTWFVMAGVEYYNHERIQLLEKKAEKYDALCEEVSALYEANRIDREYMRLLETKINQLKYDMEN